MRHEMARLRMGERKTKDTGPRLRMSGMTEKEKTNSKDPGFPIGDGNDIEHVPGFSG